MKIDKKTFKNIRNIFIFLILSILLYLVYSRLTVNNRYYKNEKNIEIPIFLYHDIIENDEEIKYDYMQTKKETFEKQIKGLLSIKYNIIDYNDLVSYNNNEKDLKKRTCMITFDDGLIGVYENAFEIIKKYNIPITVFVINDNVGMPGTISWEQAKEMEESGLVTIASHGKDHKYPDSIDTEELLTGLNISYYNIEKNLGYRNKKVFAYPYGVYTDDEINELNKAGYIQNLTDNKINNSKELDLSKLHRCYPLSDSTWKMILKVKYRNLRY